MGVTYKIDTAKNRVRIIVSGKTDASDWISCFTELKEHEFKRDDMNMLLDVRKHESVIDTKTVLAVTNLSTTKATPIKLAFLVSRVVSVGMANMASAHLEKKNIHTRIFEDENEAEDWLQGD